MRNLILTLVAVLLLATPAWSVTIILTNLGDGVVEISYDATDEAELVRAFALDVTATDGNIIDINDFLIGDDNGGYGIFPGKFAAVPIDVNPTTGLVDNWAKAGYNPVAPAGDPDALGGIGTSGCTIECGSLYEGNAPGTTGVICTITVDENVTQVCVEGNAIRGNVVLESAAEATLAAEPVCITLDTPCIPNDAAHAVQYAQYVLLGKPECWCPDWGTVDPTYGDGRNNQCNGDAAGDMHRRGYVVYTADLAALSTSWKIEVEFPEDLAGAITEGLDPCADFGHQSHRRNYVVYTTDLGILSTNWKKLPFDYDPVDGLSGDCPKTDAELGL